MTHEDLLDVSFSTDSSPAEAAREAKASEKLILIKQVLEKLQSDLNKAFQVFSDSDYEVLRRGMNLSKTASASGKMSLEGETRIIEGVFDGQNMVGPDSKRYSVPANYASKSKLVEGDILKLTIQLDGRFIYKQIGPQERARIKGVLEKEPETGEFLVLAEGRRYKVILASVTYFRGELGDEVIILVPKEKNSTWAAVENIVKTGSSLEPLSIEEAVDSIDEIEK